MLLFAVAEPFLSEFVRETDFAVFSFARHGDGAVFYRFVCDACEFADADASAADDLDHEREAVPALASGCIYEFLVVGARQLFFLCVDAVWLGFQCFDDAVVPAHVPEEAVECHEHAVGAARSVSLFEVVFVADDGLFGDVYFWWLLLYRGGWGGMR